MHVYVETPQDEDGYPPVLSEELHAEVLGPGLARLTGIPVFAMGIARGDVVQLEVRRADDRPWVVAVAENSDHWVTRVIGFGGEDPEQIRLELEELGCDTLVSSYGLVAVDVPPEVPHDQVLGLLQAGHTEGRWDFDLGVDPRLAPEVPQPSRARRRFLLGFGHDRRRRRPRG